MTKYVRPFSLKYPNAISLNMEYYNNENYNNIRRCKLILFSHCLGDNDSFKKKSMNTIIQIIQIKKCHIN